MRELVYKPIFPRKLVLYMLVVCRHARKLGIEFRTLFLETQIRVFVGVWSGDTAPNRTGFSVFGVFGVFGVWGVFGVRSVLGP